MARFFRPLAQKECRQSLNVEAGAKLVVYVGRYDVLKGLVELVRACAALTPCVPSIQLALVGEGAARPVIERTAAMTGFSARLHLVPPCASSEVAKWMNAADVFALPSYNEGCPNVVVEALGCGRPIVATQVGGIPELVNERNGILVPPRDVGALAKALADCLQRPWNVAELAAAGGRSWEDVAHEVLDACQSVVSGDLPAQLASGESYSK